MWLILIPSNPPICSSKETVNHPKTLYNQTSRYLQVMASSGQRYWSHTGRSLLFLLWKWLQRALDFLPAKKIKDFCENWTTKPSCNLTVSVPVVLKHPSSCASGAYSTCSLDVILSQWLWQSKNKKCLTYCWCVTFHARLSFFWCVTFHAWLSFWWENGVKLRTQTHLHMSLGYC